MNFIKSILFFALVLINAGSFATTWDEPWQDKIIKEADYFVFAKVKSYNEKKGVTIEIIKTLGGPELKGKIKISEFYLLDICSMSSGHGPEFHFKDINACYFFIKKVGKGKYAIATPTAGFDHVEDGKVYATYRHSYHQALVPTDIYEKTMTAIFNNYHKLPYDKQFVSDFVKENLSLKPAGFLKSERNTFFNQHVALECVYHLQLTDFYDQIIPFLNDTANFHNQVSGARALVAYNSPACKQVLLKVISDTTRGNFVQVMCIWTLSALKPTELKERLIKLSETASKDSDGFGGNIMDPRVCTHLPSPKNAIQELVKAL